MQYAIRCYEMHDLGRLRSPAEMYSMQLMYLWSTDAPHGAAFPSVCPSPLFHSDAIVLTNGYLCVCLLIRL